MAGMARYRSLSGRSITESAMRFMDRTAVPALGREMYREMTEVGEASLPLVPVDTGSLRASEYVSEPVVKDGHITCEVGYGGVATKINPKTGEPTSAYALIVHENLQAHHDVGSAKYLQIPFDAKIPGMADRIADGMRRTASGAGGSPPGSAEGSGEGDG